MQDSPHHAAENAIPTAPSPDPITAWASQIPHGCSPTSSNHSASSSEALQELQAAFAQLQGSPVASDDVNELYTYDEFSDQMNQIDELLRTAPVGVQRRLSRDMTFLHAASEHDSMHGGLTGRTAYGDKTRIRRGSGGPVRISATVGSAGPRLDCTFSLSHAT